jgi:hypothetical protein
MKPSYFLLAAGVLAAGPAPDQPPKPADAGKPMVLLLDNFQVVEGTVERVGDAYRLRRGKDVRDYPAKQVLFAGESREEVYRQMMARGAKPPADLHPAAVQAFAAKVQPVLMNLCAKCHAKPDHPGEFKLARVPDGYADPEASGRNAREAARFVTRGDPSASPLLAKAVTAHGGQREPALPNRMHPACNNLEQWARGAAGPEASPAPAKPAAPANPPPAPSPTPADPYDTAVFNRAMHPGK